MDYRKDIDGLRAIAVLLVVFFHIEVPFFTGGYIGVDVFFTISGFLISTIILSQCHAGVFSFRRFYIRRAWRLIPAYLFMIITVIGLGWLLLAPLAFTELLRTAASSAFSVSNIYFYFAYGGYFAQSSHEVPLLHSWSLSVEEQFYLLMPVAIVLWLKLGQRSLRHVVFVVILLASIALSIWLTQSNPTAAYYLVISRAFEFLLGALLAVLGFELGDKIKPSKALANVAFVLAAALLLYCTFQFDSSTAFPGMNAFWPCLATLLILAAGMNSQALAAKCLSLPPLVWFGLLSYSLYLWHWPFVAFAKYMGVDFHWWVQLLLFTVSLLMAFVSYRWVELPLRHHRSGSKLFTGGNALSLYFAPGLIFVGLFSLAHFKVISSAASDEVVRIEQAQKSFPEAGREACHSPHFNPNADCWSGAPSTEMAVDTAVNTAVLWGDSHGSHFVPFIAEVSKVRGDRVRDITMGNCPPLLMTESFVDVISARCLEKNQQVFHFLAQSPPEKLYLAGSWFGYVVEVQKQYGEAQTAPLLAAFEDTLAKLTEFGTEFGTEITVLSTLARMSKDESDCLLKKSAFELVNAERSCSFELSRAQIELTENLRSITKRFETVRWLDINQLVCSDNQCVTHWQNVPLYRDSNHLNQEGSALLGRLAVSRDLL